MKRKSRRLLSGAEGMTSRGPGVREEAIAQENQGQNRGGLLAQQGADESHSSPTVTSRDEEDKLPIVKTIITGPGSSKSTAEVVAHKAEG